MSSILGLNTPSTVDIDFLFHNLTLNENRLQDVFDEILPEAMDDIHFKLIDIKPIRDEDQYGGFRVRILCQLENIRQIVPLDIATGDVITPEALDYSFKSNFNFEDITMKAYPIETILSEKLQTIYSRGFLNSRSKSLSTI